MRRSLTLHRGGRALLRAGPLHFCCVLGRKGWQVLIVKAATRGKAALIRSPACRVLFGQAIPGAVLTLDNVTAGVAVPWFPSVPALGAKKRSLEHYPGTKFASQQYRDMGGDISRRKMI